MIRAAHGTRGKKLTMRPYTQSLSNKLDRADYEVERTGSAFWRFVRHFLLWWIGQ